MSRSRPDSPFLHGNFRPVTDEVTLANLPIRGELPPAVQGLYLRNGPNARRPSVAPTAWFDGDGMLHAVELMDGRARYLNRYVRTLEDEPDGAMPRSRLAGRNTANTSVLAHHGRVYALCDFGHPHEISTPEVRTLGVRELGAATAAAFNAHPKVDPASGELVYMRTRAAPASNGFWGVLDPRGTLVGEWPLEIAWPSLTHDFAITPAHVVVPSIPLAAESAGGEAPVWRHDAAAPLRLAVISRHAPNAPPRWFEAGSGCITHLVNARETAAGLEVTGIRYARPPAGLGFDDAGDAFAAANPGRLHAWTLDLGTGRTHEQALSDQALEFPQIDERRRGTNERYSYFALEGRRSGLVRYDARTGAETTRMHGFGRLGGEFTFVPRDADAEEDDGYLLGFVWDRDRGLSELQVLATGDLAGEPVATVPLPVRVPFGFHGAFLARHGASEGGPA
jgi:carotenoid cleavage dioxygenase